MVHLFRPELEIIEIPETIRFFPEKRYISNKIKLRKIGKGRMIIAFNIPNESQLQKLTPDDIQEFLEKVDRNLELNFINVKKSFPQYANQLDQYRFYVINGWTNYKQLSEYKKISTDILIAAIEDETFARLFIDALAKSLTTDVKLVTIPENFLKYLNSILSKKLWLLRPWESIPVSTDSQKLMIEIVPTDLLLDEYEIIRLGPIEVLADCDGSIEISRLFEWRE